MHVYIHNSTESDQMSVRGEPVAVIHPTHPTHE